MNATILNENEARHRTCTECGMVLTDAGEFHPYVFCVLKKAGRDPWRQMVKNHPELPPKPPLVRDLPRGVLTELMAKAERIGGPSRDS